jgi:RNA polymerase sigma-70 factor (ECF subfamily)
VGPLERFAAGDVDAFEGLFREFRGQVFSWILRIVRDRGVAEDLTVETFWRIHRARARFDPSRSFGAWARRIATNVALDHLKSAPREVPFEEPLAQAAAAEPDPALCSDLARALLRAFGQLPAKLRAVASLALVEEQSYADVADALGISLAAVKSREFRAVRLLRKSLARMGFEP